MRTARRKKEGGEGGVSTFNMDKMNMRVGRSCTTLVTQTDQSLPTLPQISTRHRRHSRPRSSAPFSHTLSPPRTSPCRPVPSLQLSQYRSHHPGPSFGTNPRGWISPKVAITAGQLGLIQAVNVLYAFSATLGEGVGSGVWYAPKYALI